jgi:adenylate cyclase
MAVQRRLAAILAADVAGYSRLMGENEEKTRAQFNDHLDEIVRPAIDGHNGRLVKTMGDGFLVEFGSATDAVQCAADIQIAASARPDKDPNQRKMLFRIGVHLGDVIIENEDIHGEGVNIASRIEGLAEPGGICVSEVVHAVVRNRFSFEFTDLGEQSLKNIPDPIGVFRIVLESPIDDRAFDTDALFRRPAIAVLPFENISGDPEQEYFADGLTEDIITALSLWKSFPVISRNSSFAYKGQSPDIRAVGEELGARYILEGSVRKAGQRIRVTAQLINATTGHHVWAERYDRQQEDFFELQDELTQGIASILAPEVERAEQAQVTRVDPNSLDAWGWVVRGNAELREHSAEGNIRAREMYERALSLDPNYGPGHVGMAFAHHRDVTINSPTVSRSEALSKSMEAARRAVEIDPTDSEAHVEIGIAYELHGEYEQAIAAHQRAIELNPNNSKAILGKGVSYALSGRPEIGIDLIELSIRLNPHDPRGQMGLVFKAFATYLLGDYEEASRSAQYAIEQFPKLALPHLILAACLGQRGLVDEAGAALVTLDTMSPGFAKTSVLVKENEHLRDGLLKAGLLV